MEYESDLAARLRFTEEMWAYGSYDLKLGGDQVEDRNVGCISLSLSAVFTNPTTDAHLETVDGQLFSRGLFIRDRN